jgi:hypothetical protein
MLLVIVLMAFEPLAIVVALERAEEPQGVLRESRGHQSMILEPLVELATPAQSL